MAGYSGTPLTKKLGLKDNFRIGLVNAPPDFMRELSPLPAGTTVFEQLRKPLDLILLFVDNESKLKREFGKLAAKLSPNGMLWVAWPKKNSATRSDLSFAVVQRIGLEAGLVDTKVCAINDTWSGLRFVIRVKDRNRS
jgi:hypothetical protein